MSDSKRGQQAVFWGLAFMALGVILILATLYMEKQYHPPDHPADFRTELALKLLGHVGIAAVLLGLVGIIVEFKNWRDYFEERLASTIRKKEFLTTLERDELKVLLKDVFQAYYKVRNLIYQDSFLEFFNTKIQDYIACPFRQDIRTIITVHRPTDDELCIVEEDVTYQCRKVDVESSTIQKEILWSTDYPDIVGDLRNYSITLRLPEQLPKNFSVPADLQMKDGTILFEKGHKGLKPYEGGYGFRMSLEEFKEIDELQIRMHLEYAIPIGRFFAWVMAYPSRGFHAVFHYPEDVFEIVVETFGLDSANKTVTEQPGIYSLTYDSWLLPDYGLAYQFRKPSAKAMQKTEESKTPSPASSTEMGHQESS